MFAPAFAADLVEEVPITSKAETSIDRSEWGGFYIGAYGSYNWFSPSIAGQGSVDNKNFSAGGYAGYNWDLGNQVVSGFEGRLGFGQEDTSIGGTTVHQEWDASLRARLGYAFERSLIYSFAGLAMSGVEAAALTGGETQTLTGFDLGAGFETELFENVTGRLEYGFTNYSPQGFNIGAGGSQEIDLKKQNLNLGLGFKF